MVRFVSRVAVVILLCSLSAGCAPAGYHYEAGGFTPVPNDPCQRPAVTSVGGVSWLNSSIGHAEGVPRQVGAIRNAVSADRLALASIGLRFNTSEASLLCHATLIFRDKSAESGVLSISNPGTYAPLQIEWLSDTAIAARRARVDRLATSKNLFVKPDLTNPAIQACVGRATALGAGEQFPGQLWAACSAKEHQLTR